jgi:hypothetical protein
MKKIFLVSSLFIIILNACKKDNNVEIEAVPTGFEWPAGTSDYAPYTNGSTFTFEIISGTAPVIDSFTYSVTKDTVIGGLTYRKLESDKPTLGPTYYANYNSGVITNITYNLTLQSFKVPVIKQTILKDNVPLDETWTETQDVTAVGVTVPVSFTYSIVKKDYVKNILGKDYENTIYAQQVIEISATVAQIFGLPASTQIDNYFAKGVGLVQKVATDNNLKIKRYNVMK